MSCYYIITQTLTPVLRAAVQGRGHAEEGAGGPGAMEERSKDERSVPDAVNMIMVGRTFIYADICISGHSYKRTFI